MQYEFRRLDLWLVLAVAIFVGTLAPDKLFESERAARLLSALLIPTVALFVITVMERFDAWVSARRSGTDAFSSDDRGQFTTPEIHIYAIMAIVFMSVVIIIYLDATSSRDYIEAETHMLTGATGFGYHDPLGALAILLAVAACAFAVGYLTRRYRVED